MEIELINSGVLLENETLKIVKDKGEVTGAARGKTIAAGILASHNHGNGDLLKIRFDAMASHDITYVGIIQTARASGLEKFPIPYVLTNCHNSLCAVGGTINEDDHMFGLSAAEKYGGIYVPPHQAVIHQYMRECYAGCGRMIIGSDSHTRYGALGTLAVGEGGPELVKQLLGRYYEIKAPDVVLIYLKGKIRHGVGPQDVALAIIKAVFGCGFVKNSIMEFAGPGVAGLSQEFRNGIDVMTTETACLSSVWVTDDNTGKYLATHGRAGDYRPLEPENGAYYDRAVIVSLDEIEPMIALPFHPSNAYKIKDFIGNAADILRETERRGEEQFGKKVREYRLTDKVKSGRVFVDQGVIAGCSGGTYENIMRAAAILRGKTVGSGAYTLNVYPASQPVNEEIIRNGAMTAHIRSGAAVKSCFCGPCFGAGDVPSNNGLSIRHTTRNFPNREGSKPGDGQISWVALMDAASIAATSVRGGELTPATEIDYDDGVPDYNFDDFVYRTRIYNGFGAAKPEQPLKFGPNITDWPKMEPLPENLTLVVASVINDEVTTTDELIPSGETSSYRSNPLRLAEFALSRKDPEYVAKAKAIKCMTPPENSGIGSVVAAKRPGDGSAREQAASCQKVLGGQANIALAYATKRYRSNLVNWGMLPLITEDESLFEGRLEDGDSIYLGGVRDFVAQGGGKIKAVVSKKSGESFEIELELPGLSESERDILLAGCLINYYESESK